MNLYIDFSVDIYVTISYERRAFGTKFIYIFDRNFVFKCDICKIGTRFSKAILKNPNQGTLVFTRAIRTINGRCDFLKFFCCIPIFKYEKKKKKKKQKRTSFLSLS